ncbi:MAG TPA: putative PEP-binding protein, partial [Thermoleophilaceae bacterium]|nr:putative PEP-binding protein [Thermoleophilaceae bacterium]
MGEERVLRGAPASPGLAAGHARILSPPSGTSARAPVEDGEIEAETGRARSALHGAAAELERIAANLRAGGGSEEAEIVETGTLMAADPALEQAVGVAIRERRLPAGEALLAAAEEHAVAIEALPDPLLAARADDVRSLGRRAARIADGAGTEPSANGSTYILVAEDLGPADVAEHGERAAGIALSGGAVTAHAAIVARSLGIPMVVQAGPDLLRVADGTAVVVDGAEGEVVVEASADRLEAAESASRALAHARVKERADSDLPAVTADGRRVRVLVNAATGVEIAAGLAAGAEGAGLIRTELAFLDAPGWPSRAQHARMLTPLLSALPSETATVRVLDFGGDKVPPFLRTEPRRGMELMLAHPGAFRAQLAAIAELAASSPELRLLLPLVRAPADVRLTRAMLPGHASALRVGAMIELPEAAAAAHEIAAECDFLSIGTNDLTHTTLRTDRFEHGEA